MENHHSRQSLASPANAGVNSPNFTAVLHEIYQQAQTEIDARDRKDDTYRYEPLVDPALTYISDILAEDDDSHTVNHPIEFDAYQAKAFEMAALLKEDSPALALKIERETTTSPADSGSSLEFLEAMNAGYANYGESDLPLFFSSFSEPFRNELLLNSLRGPLSSGSLPSYSQLLGQMPEVGSSPDVPHHRPPVHVEKPEVLRAPRISIGGNGQLITPVKREDFPMGQLNEYMNAFGLANVNLGNGNLHSHIPTGSQDGRPHMLKLHKPEKAGRGLKLRKEGATPRKKSAAKAKANKDGDKECIELNDLLLQCAQAVGFNNSKRALEILKKVKQHALPYGNGAERLAYYFAEAMEARFSGTGWSLYMGLLGRHPSSAEILRATRLYMASCPFVKAYHYFINQTILNVSEGASKLHILELQVDGFQYPALFKALAARPEGPPHVHLIGIGFPHYSMLPAQTDDVLEGVRKTGRQLSDYAALCGVPFEYTAWAGTRDDLCMQDFVSPHREKGEVLVVISASLLRYVMDDTLDSPVVRSKLLKQGRDINPEVYVQGIITGSYSTPFFTRRFREALFHFESVFDMLDTFIEREKTDRLVFEGEILGKAILNIVACEGTEVVDRVDKYKHWQAVTGEVGFKQLPLDKGIKDNVQLMLKTWHKEYTTAEESHYLLMGWKGRMLHAMSTWSACAEASA